MKSAVSILLGAYLLTSVCIPQGRAQDASAMANVEAQAAPATDSQMAGDVNSADKNGNTRLIVAASQDKLDVVKELLKAGADVNGKNVKGSTALMLAAVVGNAEMARLFLDAGADKDAANKVGLTSLMAAAAADHADVAKLLLDAGADKEAVNSFGFNALMQAAMNGHANMVKLLIDAGADKDNATKSGFTVMLCATMPNDGVSEADKNATIAVLKAAGARQLPDYSTVNDAFILTPEQAAKAIEKGQSMAKNGKSFSDVIGSVTQNPRGVKGQKGKSHESNITCYTLNGTNVVIDAFNAANKYEKLEGEANVRKEGVQYPRVVFNVSLVSEPKVATHRFQSSRTAAPDDVTVEKFVLTDDKGDILTSDYLSDSGMKSGNETFSGTSVIPHTETLKTNANANVNVYGSGGYYANAYGTGNSTSTYSWNEYIPWSETHQYYEHHYLVTFPLFDHDGKALIGKDVKHMTLHIIKPNGELVAEYDLKPPSF